MGKGWNVHIPDLSGETMGSPVVRTQGVCQNRGR